MEFFNNFFTGTEHLPSLNKFVIIMIITVEVVMTRIIIMKITMMGIEEVNHSEIVETMKEVKEVEKGKEVEKEAEKGIEVQVITMTYITVIKVMDMN